MTDHTHGSISLNAQAEPQAHCEHHDGSWSFKLTGLSSPVDVYVCDDPARVREWALKLFTSADALIMARDQVERLSMDAAHA